MVFRVESYKDNQERVRDPASWLPLAMGAVSCNHEPTFVAIHSTFSSRNLFFSGKVKHLDLLEKADVPSLKSWFRHAHVMSVCQSKYHKDYTAAALALARSPTKGSPGGSRL